MSTFRMVSQVLPGKQTNTDKLFYVLTAWPVDFTGVNISSACSFSKGLSLKPFKTPENERMSPKKGPIQKENIRLPVPRFFRGHVSLVGGFNPFEKY